MNLEKIESDLISEVKLEPLEAKIFLLVTTKGKMTTEKIAKEIGLDYDQTLSIAKKLVTFGGLIDISESEFEAMHPRFTAVNMYRKTCTLNNTTFKKNLIVDNIGVALEELYERARTK
ncbi:MAG: hypothetical protein ACKO7N_03085 [Candidatus Nitrosotenuis sp.]